MTNLVSLSKDTYDIDYIDSYNKRRANQIAGIRQFIDIMEANPSLTLPYHLTSVTEYVYSKEELAQWTKALPGKKDKSQTDDYFIVETRLNEHFTVKVQTSRKNVCERVVTGTELKEVDVYPEPVKALKEVDIVEWVCTEPLLAE